MDVLAIVAVLVIAAMVAIYLYRQAGRLRAWRARSARARRVEVLAEEAAMDDPAFAPEVVKAAAAELHQRIVAAWTEADRSALRQLVGRDLCVEWERRLAHLHRRGWRHVLEAAGKPRVQYVQLLNRVSDEEDRVVVHISARLRDVVYTDRGQPFVRHDDLDGKIWVSEYWTLGKRDDRWILLSLEAAGEGRHHLGRPVVPSPWSDPRIHDEAVNERAAAAAAPTTLVREVARTEFDSAARLVALDLAGIDGRFAPDVLEAAAHRALDAWAEAVDGDKDSLAAVSTPGAFTELLHPGDPSRATRLVVRGPRLCRLRIIDVDGAADPPTMTVEAEIAGRRYVQDRDSTVVLSGSRHTETAFTERWTLVLTDDPTTPWRIAVTEQSAQRTKDMLVTKFNEGGLILAVPAAWRWVLRRPDKPPRKRSD